MDEASRVATNIEQQNLIEFIKLYIDEKKEAKINIVEESYSNQNEKIYLFCFNNNHTFASKFKKFCEQEGIAPQAFVIYNNKPDNGGNLRGWHVSLSHIDYNTLMVFSHTHKQILKTFQVQRNDAYETAIINPNFVQELKNIVCINSSISIYKHTNDTAPKPYQFSFTEKEDSEKFLAWGNKLGISQQDEASNTLEYIHNGPNFSVYLTKQEYEALPKALVLTKIEEHFKDYREGRQFYGNKDTLTPDILQNFLNQQESAEKKLEYLESLFNLMFLKGRYTHIDKHKDAIQGEKRELTKTQKRHMRLLKEAYVKVVTDHLAGKPVLTNKEAVDSDPFKTFLLNAKKSPLVNYNTTYGVSNGLFKRATTSTRDKIAKLDYAYDRTYSDHYKDHSLKYTPHR